MNLSIRTASVDVYRSIYGQRLATRLVFVQHLLMFINDSNKGDVWQSKVFVQHLLIFIWIWIKKWNKILRIRTAPVDIYLPMWIDNAECVRYSYSTCWYLSKEYECVLNERRLYSYNTCWCLSNAIAESLQEAIAYSYSICWYLSITKHTLILAI